MASNKNGTEDRRDELVTVTIAGQLFGFPIARVHEVFDLSRLTKVPLASREIAGILNLRGQIMTMIDMRARLGFEAQPPGTPALAVAVENQKDSYGLIVDTVGEVMILPHDGLEPVPENLDARLAKVAAGIHRLEDQLMILFDVDRVLDINNDALVA